MLGLRSATLLQLAYLMGKATRIPHGEKQSHWDNKVLQKQPCTYLRHKPLSPTDRMACNIYLGHTTGHKIAQGQCRFENRERIVASNLYLATYTHTTSLSLSLSLYPYIYIYVHQSLSLPPTHPPPSPLTRN